MSRIQRSASVTGQCRECSAMDESSISFVRGCSTLLVGRTAARETMFFRSELVVESGCTGSPVRLSDVSQHGLFAQHGDAHPFWIGELAKMQLAVTDRSVATSIAAIRTIETVTLPNISCLLASLRPCVESGVRFLAGKTRSAHSCTRTAQWLAVRGSNCEARVAYGRSRYVAS